MTHTLEFKSYDGEYPNLCSGKLIMTLDGKDVEFHKHCLDSGGYVTFDENWNEEVGEGEWTITDFPDNFPEELKEKATDIVNTNIPHGCCGGCV